jgi:hypothetical protein
VSFGTDLGMAFVELINLLGSFVGGCDNCRDHQYSNVMLNQREQQIFYQKTKTYICTSYQRYVLVSKPIFS